MADNRNTKAAVLYLLSRGLATFAEAGRLAGKPRQTIRWWAKDLPEGEARDAHLAKQWKQAQAWAAENEPAMKMIRREMARQAREN